jgi:hypothetical protein
MLTAGDVEFEPPQSKIIGLTSSIVIMIAGDASAQAEIVHKLSVEVANKIIQEPTRWLTVSEVAYLYSDFALEFRNDRASRSILRPLGLDHASFQSQQRSMSSALVKDLASELINFQAPDISAIIAGVDETGPHLFVADYSGVASQDRVGFAAIGAGYWHAQSHFMFEGQIPESSFAQSLLCTYSAKKRAEVAPGVGESTDMFAVWSLGKSSTLGTHVTDRLETIYQNTRSNERTASIIANSEISTYVEEMARSATEQEQDNPAIEAGERVAPTDDQQAGQEARQPQGSNETKSESSHT